MGDVLFRGPRERKPLGMAQVTLTMVDPDVGKVPELPLNGHGVVHSNGVHAPGHVHGHVQAKPGEITITRRLYRSAESDYLINGRTSRLRDIQDLFMGTGLRQETDANISQRRIAH